MRQGEQVLVTDRGQVVAELRPPGPSAAELPYPGLLELARRGSARLGAENAPDLYPRLPPALPEGAALQLLTEERGEG